MSSGGKQEELDKERRYIAALYALLAKEKGVAVAQADSERASGADQGNLWQRDATAAHWSRRLSHLKAADRGLCFGRIDHEAGGALYIGRTALLDEETTEPLLIDWRAPAARPFYCATPFNPEGIVRRRHFQLRDHELVDFHDDVLGSAATEEGQATVGADSVLLAALETPRGQSMQDIVSTIQAEQDEIIRLDHPGVLLIEGGPGTGKTAVALHRVAYLLYHQRERLSRRGVLIVGPNTGFLNYIGSVLPSFGETDAVFSHPGELYPGVVATADDAPEAARIKGELSMVDTLWRAVADRQELPYVPIEIELNDVTLHIDDALAAEARERTRATGLNHNPARRHFREHLGRLLVHQGVDKVGQGWLARNDPAFLRDEIAADIRADLRSHPDFHDAVERLWPLLNPQRLLAELFSSPERLESAFDDRETAAALFRETGDVWTVSDIPLLDEAAEHLGEDTVDEERQLAAQEQAQRQYAQEVLHILDAYDDTDEETVRAGDVVDAASLAERQEEPDHRDLAERAKADRSWVYGHLVVDEAQELSPMVWRVLMRRCPTRSATVVGDLAQRHSSAVTADWSSVLADYVGDRWVHRRLTVNYRVPAEIMRLAAGVLRDIDPALEAPVSVRRGEEPWSHLVEQQNLAEAVHAAVAREATLEPHRSIAVVAAPATLATLALPEDVVPLSPVEAKGLEFDVVVVVCPDEIVNRGQRGPADLYVALTRPTHRLGIVHTSELPACLNHARVRDVTPEETPLVDRSVR